MRAGTPDGADVSYDVVIPTAGRASLAALLDSLAAADGPPPSEVLIVDDRGDAESPLPLGRQDSLLASRTRIVRGPSRGPAAARNAGWRAGAAEWVAFLDDDVICAPGWLRALAGDLDVPSSVAATQGRITVPRPPGRRPTDWERNVAGLEHARWATADMAYRRSVLVAVGGFDERFPRAYREDADLGLRVTRAGWRIVAGRRGVQHPVRTAPWSVSLAKQAGNADDVLMDALHGPGWRDEAAAPAGRRNRHLATAGAGLTAALAVGTGQMGLAAAAGAAWLAQTGELAWRRVAPGPRTPAEVATMVVTSAAMPFVATAWWLHGHATVRSRLSDAERAPHGDLLTGRRPAAWPAAVLFDRDGTLVVDVPYNGDPDRVEPVPTAQAALAKLRRAGIPTGVVSNQSGIARGLLTPDQVRAVNRRIEEMLGPLGPWTWCPHGPEDGCSCRKPAPGLVYEAAGRLGVDPRDVAVIGDIGADVEAARAAGARAVMVPTERTRAEEVAAAPHVATDLESAVDLLLTGAP